MSKRKNKASPPASKPVNFLAGDGVDQLLVRADVLFAAWESLTGINPRDAEAMARPGVRRALNVFAAAAASAASPTPALRRWLRGVKTFERSSDRQIAAVVEVVESRRRLGIISVSGYCATIVPAFATLTAEQEAEALGHLKGAHTVYPVTARLLLACGAFGAVQRPGEDWKGAVNRIAARCKQAVARARD